MLRQLRGQRAWQGVPSRVSAAPRWTRVRTGSAKSLHPPSPHISHNGGAHPSPAPAAPAAPHAPAASPETSGEPAAAQATATNRATLLVQCPDKPGVIAALAQLLFGFGCNIVGTLGAASASRFRKHVLPPRRQLRRNDSNITVFLTICSKRSVHGRPVRPAYVLPAVSHHVSFLRGVARFFRAARKALACSPPGLLPFAKCPDARLTHPFPVPCNPNSPHPSIEMDYSQLVIGSGNTPILERAVAEVRKQRQAKSRKRHTAASKGQMSRRPDTTSCRPRPAPLLQRALTCALLVRGVQPTPGPA